MEQQMARPEVLRDLKRLGIEHPLALLATQMFTNTETPTDLFRQAVVNSDFHPYLEYSAPVGFFAGSPADAVKSLDMRAWPPRERRLWMDDYPPAQPPTNDQFSAFYYKSGIMGSLYSGKLSDWAERWHAAHPDDPRAVEVWIVTRADRPDWQCEQLARAVERHPDDPGLSDLRARTLCRLLERNDPDSATVAGQARQALERARALHPDRQWPYDRLLLTLAYREGRAQEVLQLGPAVFSHLGEIGEREGAEATFDLLRMIAESAVTRNRPDVARQCLVEMRRIQPWDARLYRVESAVARMKK
jgi:hypothetical protein